MLTKRYMASVKNVPSILDKIVSGTAPSKFTTAHLKNIGFASSNDRAILGILKDLGFLSADGTPTKRYHEYRNPAHSRQVLGEALREAYEDVFHVNAKPTKADRAAIQGTFKSVNNASDRVAEQQAMKYFALLDKADLTTDRRKDTEADRAKVDAESQEKPLTPPPAGRSLHLRHNIEVHLPATKEIEVYNAIFKALKENLLD